GARPPPPTSEGAPDGRRPLPHLVERIVEAGSLGFPLELVRDDERFRHGARTIEPEALGAGEAPALRGERHDGVVGGRAGRVIDGQRRAGRPRILRSAGGARPRTGGRPRAPPGSRLAPGPR